MIRIVHISDIHFSNTENNIEMIDKYIDDLKKINYKDIDLIFMTGDLINKGGKDFKSIDEAFKNFNSIFINKIIESTKIPRERIILCPGNHDINRYEDQDFAENGIKLQLRNGKDSILKFMDNGYKDLGYGLMRIKAYKTFEKEYYSGCENSNITNFESNHIFNIDGINIGISSLNSSWRCYSEEEELILGEYQLDNSKHILKGCDIKIALMHHSTEFLIEEERKFVKEYIESNYDYLFLGHVHTGDASLNIGLRGALFTSIVQSHNESNKNLKNIDYTMGYSIIDVDTEERKIIYRNRRYVPSQKEYVDNVDLLGSKGYVEYPMIEDDEKKEQRYLKSIIKKIEDVHIEDFNSHLLTFKTDSSAPKTINEIFVQPKIVEGINKDIDKEEVIYNIDNIINLDNNIIIFGEKESGKTILLDKISIDLVNNFSLYNKIPVRIDLKDIQTIEKSIRLFLSESISKVNSLIEKNKIILIVDNLDFSNEGYKSLEELKKFMLKYTHIKVICSCEKNMSDEIPIEIIGDEFFYKFTRLNIENWKSTEIGNLITSWFDSDYINMINVNDIVDIFQNIRISVTPLNISMFLWVIEHQENYKMINDAKLIECFFEHLLEKLKIDDIYYSTFDYTNKITFLSNLAYRMLNNANLKYKILYEDLIKYTYDYIAKRKFNINGEIFVEYLINKGILISQKINEKRFIAFRFECFYRYFLTQYMLISDDFKDFVFNDKNYLNFVDEIVYYTGIKRNQEEVLKKLTERMKSSFSDNKKLIDRRDNKSYDDYFEVSNCMAERVNSVHIEKMKEEKKYIANKEYTENADNQLENINDNIVVGEVEEHNIKENNLATLYTNLTLVAKVLRNTEETENGNLKNEVYRDVITSSIIYSIISKIVMDEYINELLEEEEDEDFKKFLSELELTSRFIPLLNQELLSKLLSTAKLEIVIQEEVDKIIDIPYISELEKFIDIFILFEINNTKGLIYIEQLIKSSKKSYIRDLLLLKIMMLHRQSESKHLDKVYEAMVGNIAGKGMHPMVKSRVKGNIISDMKNKKLIDSISK